MNRKQWFVLVLGLIVIQTIFISFDSMSPLSCGIEGKPLDTGDVWCVINAEMFDPFIWLIGFLIPVFIICGFLEPKK
ncbi:MAG: hypothetical protein KKH52_03995 [Nanoarchaeota archaeon]|nr:hypothetical protein [Nanoarchaeota archaeon]MBU1623351.1 hypothetical protein [Nanoarchaeota archaeon]MBU1974531.1 hypothetical protein [Nanoarchaeota archaeon]